MGRYPVGRVYKKLILREGKVVGGVFLNCSENISDLIKLVKKRPNLSGMKAELLTEKHDLEDLISWVKKNKL